VNRLRNRLIAIFLAATLVPLAVSVWLTNSLLERSLRLASTQELDRASRSLESTGRALYQREREALLHDVESGRSEPLVYSPDDDEVESLTPGEFAVSGDILRYAVRHGDKLWVYSRQTGVDLDQVRREYTQSRSLVESLATRDLRRGFFVTGLVVTGAVWLVSVVLLIFIAYRISGPIQSLTGGLAQLALGNLDVRLEAYGADEVAGAMHAFNDTARQLKQSQERLIYFTRLASWQTLASKMAHEVKNSLTPIRLTMEELIARGAGDRFIEQAAQIVADEVRTLERRVRAFSQFAAEPPVQLKAVDVNALVEERLALLRSAHPEVHYHSRLECRSAALADEDLVRSVLTNLIENAAQAAGEAGMVLVTTGDSDGAVAIEVHDSGPGLSRQAHESLFEPTISFKKSGMGLGLSIARRSALLSGGDIVLLDSGQLSGAAFRLILKCLPNESLSSTTSPTSAARSNSSSNAMATRS
jgi:two-component system, NtrC family, nitrogen regulation sensor histidine kinase NtrY